MQPSDLTPLIGKRVELQSITGDLLTGVLDCLTDEQDPVACMDYGYGLPLSEIAQVREVPDNETLLEEIALALQDKRPPQELLRLVEKANTHAAQMQQELQHSTTECDTVLVRERAFLFWHLANLAPRLIRMQTVLERAHVALEEVSRLITDLPEEVLLARAERECPTCGGVGTIGTEQKKCWVCKGTGLWVLPEEENDEDKADAEAD
jgi:hypothetical protein